MSLAARTIQERAREIGFDLVGIAPASAWKDLEFSRSWVEKGFGGEMRYLENPKRDDPRRILPSVQSVVCVGLIYNTAHPYSTDVAASRPGAAAQGPEAPSREGPRGWVSRYAWGEDYYGVMRATLEQLRASIGSLATEVETRVYVDTGPVVERAFARFSGIGWTGKNTCLINEEKGSWFFLGVILTSLNLAPDVPAPDRCGSCTRCLEACPTGALVEPYVMDATRCIAYHTIELKGSIPEEFRSAIGSNVFGCDICQDVCPWNSRGRRQVSGVGSQGKTLATADLPEGRGFSPAGGEPGQNSITSLAPSRGEGQGEGEAVTSRPEFQPLEIEVKGKKFSLFNPPLEALASLSEADFRRIFSRSPVKRAKFRGWLRNLCVAMGNSGDPRFVPWLERARAHPDPAVREHAAWALKRLAPP